MPHKTLPAKIIGVLVPIALAVPAYFWLAQLFKIEEAKMFNDSILRRIGKYRKKV
jgi:hypothetical protein